MHCTCIYHCVWLIDKPLALYEESCQQERPKHELLEPLSGVPSCRRPAQDEIGGTNVWAYKLRLPSAELHKTEEPVR